MEIDLDWIVRQRGTVRTVAAAVGMPYETLRDWISGRRNPPRYVLEASVAAIRRLPVLSNSERERLSRPGRPRAA